MYQSPEYRQLTDYLHVQGLNVTPERMEVLSLVLKQKGHFRIEDLIRNSARRKKSISRATIYRSLKTIEQAGLIKSIRSINDEKIYEIVKGHHDHMICEQCGAIIEFHNSELESLQDRICNSRNFTASRHVMKIFGICSACQKKQE
ncbi:MAG: Fur family transcriptional regulator [Candidatus Neomarinimicrobiota bacterium]|nr:Fur family transcriptional regulator [Candidatus Neomarinimicrobiota bacterium]MDX9780307.1 Fur family transcriptional regulator [bacterium]